GRERQVTLDREAGSERVLGDDALRTLAGLGHKVEAHYRGVPQDIEWAEEGGEFFLVQTRPITTLAAETEGERDGGEPREGDGEPAAGSVLVAGLAASPGIASG